MKIIFINAFLILLILSQIQTSPWGVRISFGQFYSDSSYLTQLYITFNLDYYQQNVKIQIDNLNYECLHKKLVIPGKENDQNFTTFIYRCSIFGLKFPVESAYLHTEYTIYYGPNLNKTYQMKIINKNIKQKYSAVAIGDWGLLDQTVSQKYYDVFPCLHNVISKQSQISFFIFLGDMAYQLNDNNCQKYRRFLIALERFTSYIPFMLSPGNHDTKYNYQLFTNSFSMPFWSQTFNYFYTFQVGQSIFISYNPQTYVYGKQFDNNGINVLENAKQFFGNLQSKMTNKIVFSHYPIYCSDPNDKQCKSERNRIKLKSFLQIFSQNKVDLYISAHIHVYQRNYPITKNAEVGQFEDLSKNQTYGIYKSPKQTVFISEGTGGNTYFVYENKYKLKKFTANMIPNTGFGVLSLKGNQQLIYDHYEAKDCSVGDHLQIIKSFSIKGNNKNPKIKIFGIIVGVLLGVSLLIFLIIFILRRYRLKKQRSGLDFNQEKYSVQI